VEIEVAGDGDQAIAALQRPSAHFSCVLLDIKLPTKTGLEVLNGFAHSRALDDCRW
jgi:CheY-like chemotaxis protein